MGKQDTLSEHALESRRELDFGDSEGVSQVERSIHVGEGEVAKPLGIFFAGLRRCHTLHLLRRRCVNLEDALLLPSLLVFCLEGLQEVALAGLVTFRIVISSATPSKRRSSPVQALWPW